MSSKLGFSQFELNQIKEKGDCVVVEGKKLGPPSKRFTLTGQRSRVKGAEITKLGKKDECTIVVSRINFLPSRSEVRLHTDETLYPGIYRVAIWFK